MFLYVRLCLFTVYAHAFHIFPVYYYHEVLQLFKKECYDMVVMQSEKVDGEKYLISMQSEDRQGVTSPDGTLRVKVKSLFNWVPVDTFVQSVRHKKFQRSYWP